MVEKQIYANGQKVYDLKDTKLTYYFKNGALKAHGEYVKNKRQGIWYFYRKNGDLWKVGHYKDGVKHGKWERSSPEGKIEADHVFDGGQLIKKV